MDKYGKKGSGRTTRMLAHAVDLAKKGQPVYVVMASEEACRAMETILLTKFYAYSKFRIVFGTTRTWEGLIDWESMTMKKVPFNTVLLVDHYVLEKRIHRQLQIYEQYDPGVTEWLSWNRAGQTTISNATELPETKYGVL